MLKFLIGLTSLISISLSAQTYITVGKNKVSIKEFNDRYNFVSKNSLKPPTKDQFTEDIVRLNIGLQEAKKYKLEKDPLVIQQIEQVLYAAMIEKAIGKKVEKIKVSDNEMKSYYKNAPELRISHILVELPPKATSSQIAAAKKRADGLLKDIKRSKKPFAELAALYSDDFSTKRNGGDIGWTNKLTLHPAIYNTALKLSVGSISGVVRTNFGFHIVKLVDKNKYENANKRILRQTVFDEKRNKLFDSYFNKLKSKYPVSVNKNLLK